MGFFFGGCYCCFLCFVCVCVEWGGGEGSTDIKLPQLSNKECSCFIRMDNFVLILVNYQWNSIF